MKLFLLLVLPACIIGQAIRLQIPVFTFQPVKISFPAITIGQTRSLTSRNDNNSRAPTARTSGISTITPVRSSNNGAQQLATRNPERQTSVFMSRVRNSVNARTSSANSQNVRQLAPVVMSTNRNNNSPTVLSTRSSINDPQPQESVVRQNSMPVTSASSNVNIPSTSSTSSSQTQQATPGNVARQIKLLMSRNGNVVSTRSSSISSASGPSCSTPDGENGVCTHVSDCGLFLPYMDLIEQPAIQTFFIERVCRITNMEMHVCCPRSPFAQGPALRSSSSVVPRENECGFPITNRLVNGEQVSNFFGGGC